MSHLISASLYVPSIGMIFPLTSLAKLKLKTASRDAIVAQTVESAACRPMHALVSRQKEFGAAKLSLSIPSTKSKCQYLVIVIEFPVSGEETFGLE